MLRLDVFSPVDSSFDEIQHYTVASVDTAESSSSCTRKKLFFTGGLWRSTGIFGETTPNRFKVRLQEKRQHP